MKNKKMHTCCFSGNRPEKLPWRHDEGQATCLLLKEEIRQAVLLAIQSGYQYFISGMAQGIDMYAAEIILSLREEFDIFLEAAIPYQGQEKRWADFYIQRYHYILSKADKQITLSPIYYPNIYHYRNEYMIEHSNLLIAATTGDRGGTAYTIAVAKTKGINLNIIDI